MGDRIWNINISPYDQVFALTQHLINQGIDNLYKRLETGEIVDDAVLPQPANCEADEHNYIQDVVFGPPSIIVKADYTNCTEVLFRISLKSGEMQLRRYLGKDPKTKKVLAEIFKLSIDNWIVTFPVDVRFTKLSVETPRGKAVEDRSAAKGRPNHSIYELLLDLESMSLSDATWEWGTWQEDDYLILSDKSKIRPPGFKEGAPRRFLDLSRDFQVTMQFFVERISPQLKEANLNSMGFAVMADDANRRATFEVNNVRYMTYPWTNPDTGAAAPQGIDGDSQLNYLLYLETVGKNVPPASSDSNSILKTDMGNWTEGRYTQSDAGGKFGTFVLSKGNFMEQFVIPKFSNINRIMSIDIYDVQATCKARILDFSYNIGATFVIGAANSSENDTTFRMRGETLRLADDWPDTAKNFLQPLTKNDGAYYKVWTYKDIEWGPTAKHAYCHNGSVEVWMHGDTISFTRAYIRTNRNDIVYEGRTWSKFEYKIDPSLLAWNRYGKLTCQCEWKITLTLQEVTDGGLAIALDYQKPSTSYPEEYGESPDLKSIKSKLTNMYEIAGTNFEYYMNSLRNALQGQEKFTLPASGVFFFKNPVFNSVGDLVCDIEYNGNPKLSKKVNESADKTRDNVSRGELAEMPEAVRFSEEKIV